MVRYLIVQTPWLRSRAHQCSYETGQLLELLEGSVSGPHFSLPPITATLPN